jgi:cytochrome oxidase Cu insertion factor (SCO1/SenC/PrrC family)
MIEAGRVAVVRTRSLALALALAIAVVAGVAGGVVLHRLRAAGSATTPALPELNGQATWAAGERPAPGFALRDQRGAVVSLSALRGRPVLLTFLATRCDGCAPEALRLASVLRRLPAVDRPTLVILSLDPRKDTLAAIDVAARRWGLGGAWTWHWLTAPRARLAAVSRAYGVGTGSAQRLRLVLIDRRGDERTAYLFPFLPAFVEGDLARLAGERR